MALKRSLANLTAQPAEQVITGMFTEVKRHKPSVVYIPHVDAWYTTLGATALTTLITMLRDIPQTDPVLLLGTADCEASEVDGDILKGLFGLSKKNRIEIARPSSVSIHLSPLFTVAIEANRK